LGKILAQLEKWREFFSKSDGTVLVHGDGIKYFPSDKLYASVQAVLYVDRVTGRKVIAPSRRRKAKIRQEPAEQTRIGIWSAVCYHAL
jgi:hypothetical protein